MFTVLVKTRHGDNYLKDQEAKGEVEGLIGAIRKLGLTLPLVVRMEGTSVEMGKRMLAESRLGFTSAEDMGVGAGRAVESARAAS